jgi:hypothetical protein
MNKLTGWIILVVTSFLIFVFAMSLLVFIPDLFKTERQNNDSIIAIVFFVILLILLIFGFRYGLKKIKPNKAIEIIAYTKELDIRFNSRIEYKDYRNLIFGLSFKKPGYLVSLGFLFLILVNLYNQKEYFLSNHGLLFPLLASFLIFIFIPLLILYQTKNAYKTSKIFHENISYALGNEVIRMKGETFESEVKWNHFYKIKETKNFFMLYQGKVTANLLDKKAMSDNDIDEFRIFIKSLNVIKE